MAHLKKGISGHLLLSTGGHLVNDCGGMAGNTCNSCSPPIPDTFYATLAGLAGDLAGLNGKVGIDWQSACNWIHRYNPPAPLPYLLIRWNDPAWVGDLFVNGTCFKQWQSDGGYSCAPWDATFAELSCEDGGCTDPDTCTDSLGGTLVVTQS